MTATANLSDGLTNEQAAAGAGHTSQPRLPRRIFWSMLARLTTQIVFVVLIIQGVFLIEKMNYFLEASFDRSLGVGNLFKLLLLTSPEILDLALPVALLIAVYRVFLQARENNELLALSNMGLSLWHFLPLVAFVTFCVQVAAVAANSFLAPAAHLAYRKTLYEGQHRTMLGGLTPGRLDFFANHVVFHRPSAVAGQSAGILLHEPRGDGVRVTVPNEARLQELTDRELRLSLSNFLLIEIGPDDENEADASASPKVLLSQSRIRTFERSLRLDNLLPFTPSVSIPSEWRWGDGLDEARRTIPSVVRMWNQESLRRIGRLLILLQIPLLAAVVLCAGKVGAEVIFLPCAFVFMLAMDVLFQAIRYFVGQTYFYVALLLLISITMAVITATVGVVRARHRNILKSTG